MPVVERVCDECGAEATGYAQDIQDSGAENGWVTYRIVRTVQFCDRHARDGVTYGADMQPVVIESAD